MSGRKIYSTEIKLEIVERYLKEYISLKQLSQEYHVTPGDIQKWRDAYLEHGLAGLITTHRTYTGNFKVSVVEYMHNTGASIRKTAAHFNIPSFRSVAQWAAIYNEQGKDALYEEKRGRASKMKAKKPQKPKSTKKTNKKTNTTEYQELLAELEYLRMENEYLKKLQALVRKREESEHRTKQLSSQS